jgi:two-component system cell cycle sensor histidine kinase/response regulator CckA
MSSPPNQAYRSRMSMKLPRLIVAYLWAVAAVALGVLLRSLLTPVLDSTFPFITFFPVTFVVAYVGGLGPTLFAAVLSMLAVVYLFVDPLPTLQLSNPADQVGSVLFLLSGITTGWLGESRLRARRVTERAIEFARSEAARAEEEAARAEEESARAEEEMLRAEEETARAETESRRATRESERVDRILSSITDAFMVLDRDWNITYMNERAATLAGGTPADYIGRNHWEAFPESVDSPFDKAYRRAVAGQHVVRVEAYSPPIGKWLQVTAYPSPDGLTLVGQDVSDRRRAQEATARLAAIVDSSEDAIVGKQLDGTVLTWNAAAERIFGYSADEMVGHSIYRLIPPELHAAEREALQRVSRGEPVGFAEVERIRKDGEHIFIALTVSPIRDSAGNVVGVSSIKRNVTAQRKTRAALTAESTRSRELAQALDASQAMVRRLDGTVTYWSSGSARLYGWSVSEALGRVSHELLHTEFPVPLDEIQAELEMRGRWEGEVTHQAKDGHRVQAASQWILRRGRGDEKSSVIELNTDITVQRLMQERVRESDRMELVGQLAGGVAHEANNQMTVILGATSFLLASRDLTEEARKDLEYIREAAERTAGITGQLLTFSRRQIIQPKVLDLDEAVQGLEGVLRRALGERSTLVLQLRAGGRVRIDPGQLDQVVLNLILNSRDAMPLGGVVTVETRIAELTEAYVRQRPGEEIVPGHYAVLCVIDTGHGMTRETLNRMFEPFYTTKAIGQGTGLGLATVHGIVKQSRGYASVYSEVGQGTTFKIYLPLASEEVAPSKPRAAPVRATGQTVLLVEDDPAVRHMTSRVLQEYGFAVVEASGGHQALGIIERNEGGIDLLITDVILPGMDGTELARRATELQPHLGVLFVSGYTDDDIVRRGLLDAGRPFLQKPFTPEALVTQLNEILKHQGVSLAAGNE